MAAVRRWVRRLVRAAAWTAKAVLFAVAVAAAVAWCRGRDYSAQLRVSRWAVEHERVDHAGLVVTLRDRNVVLGVNRAYWRGDYGRGRQYASRFGGIRASGGTAWRWAFDSSPGPPKLFPYINPFWASESPGQFEAIAAFRTLPVWLIAGAAGAWPAASAALWARRWRQNRRRWRAGLCSGCGYDLRASPDADGPTLAVCPECGRPTPPAGMR
jgi:hypothetical protein